MGDKSNIEWTDATWNPIVGCSIVSPGCTNCYAMKQARRIELMWRGPRGARSHYAGMTKVVNGNVVWTGEINVAPNKILYAPLYWKKSRRIFVNSMGDLFHEYISDKLLDQVFAIMRDCPQHQFQVLTKRSARMQQYCDNMYERIDMEKPFPNVWLGVSVERQQEADYRIPDLLNTPAAVRFLSCEPLLGPLDLQSGGEVTEVGRINWLTGFNGSDPVIPGIDWVIVGGESGPGARPMDPAWARSIRDQCWMSNVPFFFKQHGEWRDGQKMGKHAAGRLLDGVEHNGYPA